MNYMRVVRCGPIPAPPVRDQARRVETLAPSLTTSPALALPANGPTLRIYPRLPGDGCLNARRSFRNSSWSQPTYDHIEICEMARCECWCLNFCMLNTTSPLRPRRAFSVSQPSRSKAEIGTHPSVFSLAFFGPSQQSTGNFHYPLVYRFKLYILCI